MIPFHGMQGMSLMDKSASRSGKSRFNCFDCDRTTFSRVRLSDIMTMTRLYEVTAISLQVLTDRQVNKNIS